MGNRLSLKSRVVSFSLFGAALLFSVGCGGIGSSGSEEEASSAPLTATFSSISANILQPRCYKCHNSLISSGGRRFDSYNSTMNSVVAGAPNSSPLYVNVLSGNMPREGLPLSDAEVAMIGEWILDGALNN
jgi:hypothetical protein